MTPEEAKFLSEILIGQIEQEVPTTKRVLAAAPEDRLDYKLGEKGRTLGELMWHIAQSEVWFANATVKGEFPMDEEGKPPASAKETLAWYGEKLPPLLTRMKSVPAEKWATPVNFFNVFNFPLVFYLSFWTSHTVHHRGQMSTYLRALNAHVPSIYGGSADEPFEMPATA